MLMITLWAAMIENDDDWWLLITVMIIENGDA